MPTATSVSCTTWAIAALASATSTKSSVAKIWHSEQRRQVVEMCLNALDFTTCQVCCKGHEINKLIHFIDHPDPAADVNFL